MNLVEIIRAMTTADGRATRELPRGLHLVYYPPAGDQPARLIAGRYLSTPSPTELLIVRDALLDALDHHPALVAVDVAAEWQETGRGDWQGYTLTFHTLSAAAAFSHDEELRRRVRLALEQREVRALKRRRGMQKDRRPAANLGPDPML